MSIVEHLNQLEKMWQLTSLEGRRKLLSDLKAKGAEWETELNDDQISMDDDFNNLPEDLQGNLIIIYTPDGWHINGLNGSIIDPERKM